MADKGRWEDILCISGRKRSMDFTKKEIILDWVLQFFVAVAYPEKRQLFLQLCFPVSTEKGLK